MQQALDGLQQKVAQVGWFPSAKYGDGKPVAGVAYVQEFGSTKRGIPPRPFFRTTSENQRSEWANLSRRVAKAVLQGRMPPEALVEAVALKAEGDVRATISKITTPALAPATLRARARRSSSGQISVKPLVDSGLMLATLTSQVIDK